MVFGVTADHTSVERGQAFRARYRDLRLAMEDAGVAFYKGTGLPAVGNRRRKAACAESLALFAVTYLPRVFMMPMSPGQRADLAIMQKVIVDGGRFAFASPRGDGKTSRVEAALIWAALYGRRRCVVIVAADMGAALEILEGVKTELRTNELLRADFPLPCWAAALSDDTALKSKGWTWGGVNTAMRWSKGGVVLPVVPGADGAGCVIVPRGLTGRLRGMRVKVAGEAVRPDLFAVDDPQTDESAASISQVDTRENLILGAIMGSGGPTEAISAMMPCTVIKHDDLAARFLDRKRHPDWQGSARGLVTTWPDAQKTLWKEYAMKRKSESQEAANTFYQEHREEMDKGAVLDWPDRFVEGKETSALQHAENLLTDLGEEVFSAEYQNDPKEKHPSVYDLTPALVASRIHPGRKPGEIPPEGRSIVAATDLNHYGAHFAVAGFANDSTAWLAWYGRHDNGGRGIIQPNTSEGEAKKLMFEALVIHGQQLTAAPLTREGQAVSVGLWLIDSGYMPDVVKRYLEGPARTLGIPVMAARGYAADRYRPTPKNCIGRPRECCHLAESPISGRFLAFNADYWREVSQRAWLGTPNAPGSVSLFDGGRHQEFAEQVTREKLLEKLKGDYGMVWRWAREPGWHDYGDVMTMLFVAAAWGGIGTMATAGPPTPEPAPTGIRVLKKKGGSWG